MISLLGFKFAIIKDKKHLRDVNSKGLKEVLGKLKLDKKILFEENSGHLEYVCMIPLGMIESCNHMFIISKHPPLSLVLDKLNLFIVSYIHGHKYKESDSFVERVDFQFRAPPSVNGYFVLWNTTQWLFITGIL